MGAVWDVASQNVASVQTKEYDELLRLLKEKREEAKISQERLSEALGRSITYIQKIESGSRRIDVVEFVFIMNQLGFDPPAVLKVLMSRAFSKPVREKS